MQPVEQLANLFGNLNLRMNEKGAQKGDLNIALMWNDPSDLDIHVICPCGTHIYYGTRSCSKCKANLDVDMNRNEYDISNSPVENIFWSEPPQGHYKIYVHNYRGRRGNTPSPFKCLVTSSWKSRVFTGCIPPLNNITLYDGDISALFNDLPLPNIDKEMGVADELPQGNYNLSTSASYDPSMPPSVAVININGENEETHLENETTNPQNTNSNPNPNPLTNPHTVSAYPTDCPTDADESYRSSFFYMGH